MSKKHPNRHLLNKISNCFVHADISAVVVQAASVLAVDECGLTDLRIFD
jgi:hypothetical protein